ncbi:hypothetical protein ACLOJK_014649 [Asimina triloba]
MGTPPVSVLHLLHKAADGRSSGDKPISRLVPFITTQIKIGNGNFHPQIVRSAGDSGKSAIRQPLFSTSDCSGQQNWADFKWQRRLPSGSNKVIRRFAIRSSVSNDLHHPQIRSRTHFDQLHHQPDPSSPAQVQHLMPKPSTASFSGSHLIQQYPIAATVGSRIQKAASHEPTSSSHDAPANSQLVNTIRKLSITYPHIINLSC